VTLVIAPQCVSDRLRPHLQLQPERIGEAIGQIDLPDQQMQVDGLSIGEIALQPGKVIVGDLPGLAGQLLGVDERRFLRIGELGEIAVLQRAPVFGGESGSLRRSEMVLRSIVAAVENGDPDVDHLVEARRQGFADAGVESDERGKRRRHVRHGLVYVSRVAAQAVFVDLLNFGGSLLRFDERNASHTITSKVAGHQLPEKIWAPESR
jgi:hypothetical protein